MSDGLSPLVTLQHVTRVYADHVSVRAVDDVSFALDRGAFAVLAGPSGSGKTTLLNLIGGLDRPDAGTIRVGDANITAMDSGALADFRLAHVGFIFQAFNLFPVLTVLENLEFVAALQGASAAGRRRRARELLSAVGLEGLGDKRPNELSGGQQQRVAVARSILTEPEVVLADEPTANLDSTNAERLLDLMERLNRERGVTFLFSTHDPQVMARAHRVIRLRDGSIEADEERPPRRDRADS
jgi:putative ABC transport system ATP-binding protein